MKKFGHFKKMFYFCTMFNLVKRHFKNNNVW